MKWKERMENHGGADGTGRSQRFSEKRLDKTVTVHHGKETGRDENGRAQIQLLLHHGWSENKWSPRGQGSEQTTSASKELPPSPARAVK